MTPLLPHPDDYLYNLITMTSPEAKRLWRRAIKEHFGCTCVYCGQTYDLHELTIDHVHPRCLGGEDMSYNVVPACSCWNQAKGSNKWPYWVRDKFGVNRLSEQIILANIQ